MNVSVGTQTHPGRRPNNEDLLLVVDVRAHRLRADGILVIADGMGGRSFGERAAQEAVEAVQATLTEMLADDRPDIPISEALATSLRRANSRVYDLAARDPESRGMGTTCVVAVVAGDRLHVAHAGDSRAYLLREGKLHRLTDDHSYVAEQVRAGMLSEEGARRSRFRNVITRAVGIEPTITPDVSEQDAQPGDRLLLCTDGLSNMVNEDALADALGRSDAPQDTATRLVEQAVRSGGTDNVTAIVARLDAGNRTQRMKADDLARLLRPRMERARSEQAQSPQETLPAPSAQKTEPPLGRLSPSASNGLHRDGLPPPAQEDTPTVRPAAPQGHVFVPMPTDAPAPAPLPRVAEPPRRSGRAGLAVLAVLSLLLAGGLAFILQAVQRDGYHLQSHPPFVVKPAPPLPPRPPDLAHLQYRELALLTPTPVRDGLLSYSAADDAVTVVSDAGQVVRLRADGQTLTKYALPGGSAPVPDTPVSPSPPSAGGSPYPAAGQAFASDTQGNLYVADAARHTVTKYAPGGGLLGLLAAGHWQKPTAIAVGTDGTVFVVDAQRLKVLRPSP